MSKADVADGAGTRMQADDAKLAVAQAEFERAISKDLVPELMKLIPVVKDMTPTFIELLKTGIPAFVELIKTIADFANAHKGILQSLAAHPIGAIMAFEVTKSIGGAALGPLVSSLIARAFAGSAGGGAGLGGGAGAGGALPIVAAGAAAIALAKGTVTSALDGQTGGQMDVGIMRSNAKNGGAKGKAQNDAMVADANKRTGAGGVMGLIGSLASLPGDLAMRAVSGGEKKSVAGDDDFFGKVQKFTHALEIETESKGLRTALDSAALAATAFADKANAASAAPPNGPIVNRGTP